MEVLYACGYIVKSQPLAKNYYKRTCWLCTLLEYKSPVMVSRCFWLI